MYKDLILNYVFSSSSNMFLKDQSTVVAYAVLRQFHHYHYCRYEKARYYRRRQRVHAKTRGRKEFTHIVVQLFAVYREGINSSQKKLWIFFVFSWCSFWCFHFSKTQSVHTYLREFDFQKIKLNTEGNFTSLLNKVLSRIVSVI